MLFVLTLECFIKKKKTKHFEQKAEKIPKYIKSINAPKLAHPVAHLGSTFHSVTFGSFYLYGV